MKRKGCPNILSISPQDVVQIVFRPLTLNPRGFQPGVYFGWAR